MADPAPAPTLTPPSYAGYVQTTRRPLDPLLLEATAATWGNTVPPPQSPAPVDPGAQAAYSRDLWTNVGISAGLQGVQLAAQMLPTAQDRRNTERMAELEQLEAQGKLGLSGQQRAQMEQTLLAPVRGLATEQRQRAEAQAATLGNTTSAADLSRIQRGANQQAQQAAMTAGLQISQEHLNEARRQLDELESRTAYKSERQKERREDVSQAIGAAGSILGQTMASRAVPQLDLSGLMQTNPEQAVELAQLVTQASANPNPLARAQQIQALQSLAAGLTPARTAPPAPTTGGR